MSHFKNAQARYDNENPPYYNDPIPEPEQEPRSVTITLESLQAAFDKIRPQVGHIYNDRFDDFIIKLWQEMNKK